MAAPLLAQAALKLGSVYRGDDGSALYLRVIDDRLFGFGEHAQRGYAYVLSGSVQDDRVDASFLDVPKRGRHESGQVALRISQGGARIELEGDNASIGTRRWQAATDTAAIVTTRRPAGFQSTRRHDLDGAFAGNDGSSHYWREVPGEVAGVAERPAGSGRLGRVTVFVGQRSGSVFNGRYVDIQTSGSWAHGLFSMVMQEGSRDLTMDTLDGQKTRQLRAEYVIDFDGFAGRIVDSLQAKVVGFGYAIAKDDTVVRSGARGLRRRPPDGSELAFTDLTQNESASTTKLVTAAVALRLLNQRGLTPDNSIATFVPDCWTRGPGIALFGLSFRQLLQHKSGITRPAACSNNPYECLRQSIETGQTMPIEYDYQNINYTLFRYLIPMLRDGPGTNAIFGKYQCDSAKGEQINAEVSERYRQIVIDEVLAPLGIDTGFEPSAPQWANRYDFSQPGEPGMVPNGDDVLRAGSGGMKWSAREYGKFLAALETGRIVPFHLLRLMKSDLMGFDGHASGDPGGYPWKNGGAGGTQSWAMVFPSGIGAYITINSDNNAYGPRDLGQVLRDAFDESLLGH